MTAPEFFRRHSYSFRNIIARFYPLNKALITAFKPCFDDNYLSFNPNISDEILANFGIKRISNWEYFNKELPLESVLVSTFLDKGTSPIPYLNDHLMSDELIIKDLNFLMGKGYSFKYLALKPNNIKWSFEIYDLLYKTKNGLDYFITIDFFGNQYVYKNLFEPYLNDALVQDILSEKYQAEISQNNLKYYHIQQGATKEMIDVEILNKEALNMQRNALENDEIENLTDIKTSEITMNGRLINNYSTTPILADFIKIRNADWGINLCFSARVKKVLEQFNLPLHSFTPIACTWDERTQKKFKITEAFTYYIFNMDSSELWRNLDYSASTFVTLGTPQYGQGFNNDFIVDKHILVKDFDDFVKQRGEGEHWLDIICTKYVSPQNWDVLGFDFVFLVNEDVKKALEKLKPISMRFVNEINYSRQKALHFHLLGAETDEHRKRNAEIIQSIDNELIEDISKAKIEALKATQKAKIERLEANTDGVKNYFTAKNDAASITSKEAEIRAKEIALNVLFPKAFREKLLTDKAPKTMRKYYEPLTLATIFSIGSGENGWQNHSPEAINAVAIAGDGCGNYIGFLLKENDDFQLDKQLVFFDHETAKIEDL
jgi:hypothetical protein